MHFIDWFAPRTVSEFRQSFGRQAFASIRQASPYPNLVTVAELELRLNDGCATACRLGVIGPDGRKLAPEEVYHPPGQHHWVFTPLRKSRVAAWLEDGCSVVMHNMTHLNPNIARIVSSIEDTFEGYHTDLHVYLSPQAAATGYRVHRDTPQHKIYLQHIGSSHWTVYRGTDPRTSMTTEEAGRTLSVDFAVTLTPGSAIYLPPDTFHHVVNEQGSRVSLSFPFVHAPATKRVDRTHIDLTGYFTSGVRTS